MGRGNGSLEKLHNEGLHDLWSSPNITRLSKAKRLRWAKDVAPARRKRYAYRFF
jgi:hypothetical protein